MSDKAERTTAQAFPAEVLNLFDKYVHGVIDRRGFLEQGALLVAAGTTASAVLAALSPDFAHARIAAEDPRITVTREDISSPKGYGTIKAYVARPRGMAPRTRKPVILVVHENRGLNPHIEDIARRLAVDGYIAVAPDALTSLGGYPGDEDKARALFGQLDQAKAREDFVAAAEYAKALRDSNGKLGAVGFCYGGGIVNMLATRVPTLRAAVPFYGPPPPLEAVPSIKAELLLHFAGNDARVNSLWPDYEKALKAAGTRYRAFIYPGVEHGFNNDTTPRFDEKAAALAWKRTMALLKRTLA